MNFIDRHRAAQADRRRFNRFDGHGMVAIVNGALINVVDVSLTGLKFASAPVKEPGKVDFTLYVRTGKKIDLNRGVRVKGEVVHGEGDYCSVTFTHFTYSLAKLIISYTSATLGVEPHMVR